MQSVASPRQVITMLVVLMAGLTVTSRLYSQTPTPAASPSPTATTSVAKEDLLSTIKTSGNFKTFLKVAEAAGLTGTLQKAGPYTVFAPTDAAFAKLPAGNLDDLLKPENKAKLVNLVSYHLANGKLSAVELSKTDEVKTLEGTEIDVDTSTDGKTIELDEAKILGSDLEASNGVVHAIDTVLQP